MLVAPVTGPRSFGASSVIGIARGGQAIPALNFASTSTSGFCRITLLLQQFSVWCPFLTSLQSRMHSKRQAGYMTEWLYVISGLGHWIPLGDFEGSRRVAGNGLHPMDCFHPGSTFGSWISSRISFTDFPLSPCAPLGIFLIKLLSGLKALMIIVIPVRRCVNSKP